MRILLRLILSKPSRKLINLQRRVRVLELPPRKAGDESSSDSDPNFSDADKSSKFLDKLTKDVSGLNEDKYA